jgi:hypothetical protein
MASTPTARKAMMAATLIQANQNSNSPKLRVPMRLMPVKVAMKSRTQVHCGTAGSQPVAILAAALASTARTTTKADQ